MHVRPKFSGPLTWPRERRQPLPTSTPFDVQSARAYIAAGLGSQEWTTGTFRVILLSDGPQSRTPQSGRKHQELPSRTSLPSRNRWRSSRVAGIHPFNGGPESGPAEGRTIDNQEHWVGAAGLVLNTIMARLDLLKLAGKPFERSPLTEEQIRSLWPKLPFEYRREIFGYRYSVGLLGLGFVLQLVDLLRG